MTVQRPAPIADTDSAPYWQAANERRLLIQYCPRCDRHQFYPRLLCRVCLGPVTLVEAAGTGVIYSFTVVHRAPPGFDTPYVVALVDLDEGPRMMANLVGAAPAQAAIGQRVRVTYEDIGEGRLLPQFTLSS